MRKALSIALSFILVVTLTPIPLQRSYADSFQAASSDTLQEAQSLELQASSDSDEVKILQSRTFKPGVVSKVSIDVEGTVVWSSTKPGVASVETIDNAGEITCHASGTAIIIADCVTIGKKYGFKVIVNDPKAVALSKKAITLKTGKKAQLKLSNAEASKVKWASKNKKVATVTKAGVVQAKKAGKTTVVATYNGKKYTCKVTVKKGETTPTITVTKLTQGSKSAVASQNSAATIGSLKKDGYEVDIPAGAFDQDTQVTVTVKDDKIDVTAAGKSAVRLDEMATIKVALTGPVPADQMDDWRGVYHFDGEDNCISADLEQLSKGVAQYEVAFLTQSGGDLAAQAEGELSTQGLDPRTWFSAKKLTDAEKKALVAHAEAVYEYSKDTQNALVQKFIEKSFGKVADDLGFPEGDKGRDRIMKQLGKSADLLTLVRAASEGDESTFTSKATEMVTNVLIENADSTKVGWLATAAGTVPEVLQNVKDGDYKGASKAVAKAVASNMPGVQQVQFAAAITEVCIDFYVDSETEAAYKAYSGMVKEGGWGYSAAQAQSSSWEIIEQQMAAPLRQMNDRAVKAYAEAHNMLPYEVPKETQESIRAMVKNNIIKQFESRRLNDAAIEQREKDTLELFTYIEKEGLMNRNDLSVGFDLFDDYELRVHRLLSLRNTITEMMGGKTYAELTGHGENSLGSAENVKAYNFEHMAKLIAVWVENGWTPGGNAVMGRQAVAKELAKLGVGVKLLPGNSYEMTVILDEDAWTYEPSTAQFSLEGIFDGTPTWISSDKKIATVDKSGMVTALKPGTVTITAKYGSKEYDCKLTVKRKTQAEASDYRLNVSEIHLTNYSDTYYVWLCKKSDPDTPINAKDSDDPRINDVAWQFCVNPTPSEVSYIGMYSEKTYKWSVEAFSLTPTNGYAYIVCQYHGVKYKCKVYVEVPAIE